MADYTKKTEAPKTQWLFETNTLYYLLPPDSKEKVFDRYYQWIESARKRYAQEMEPDYSGLDKSEKLTLFRPCSTGAIVHRGL